ncbi:hypothetical protein RN001_013071 [Aquatica leii]|uniref:Uncharacterized protein n=1 Tax=Aquatica leii TaxID=1421715 RepID=A0AAN7P3V6_9COLE|nr:hypothetical protein RN001_013071 [Aquatica leii]
MPTTIHKLLVHGPEIIASALLPIGQLSEEAQESSNKLIKKFRRDNSRKNSRTNCMKDVFLRLMACSDPLISNLRKLPRKKVKLLSLEALDMLIMSSASSEISDSSTENSDASSASETEKEDNSDDESWSFF